MAETIFKQKKPLNRRNTLNLKPKTSKHSTKTIKKIINIKINRSDINDSQNQSASWLKPNPPSKREVSVPTP